MRSLRWPWVPFVSFVVPLLLTLGGCCLLPSHPTDTEMIAAFRAKRAEFEALRRMFVGDRGLDRVGADFTRPEDPSTAGVSPERLAAYSRAFAALGLREGIEGYGEKREIWFHVSARGLAIAGSLKGYYWSTEEPDLLVGDVDAYRSPEDGSFVAYHRIESARGSAGAGAWYVFLDVRR